MAKAELSFAVLCLIITKRQFIPQKIFLDGERLKRGDVVLWGIRSYSGSFVLIQEYMSFLKVYFDIENLSWYHHMIMDYTIKGILCNHHMTVIIDDLISKIKFSFRSDFKMES